MTKANFEKDPLWFKQAIIYQLHIKSYYDFNADGVGDFAGLRVKLDYLESLGITAIWLLPFYPSPMRDDGYDIANYYDVNSSYGTLADFKRFLREAHRKGIRVITELVINHTSDQHPWFQRARHAKPGSAWRDFYVWSDTPDKYNDARIIFQDFEASNWTWDPVAKAYFWHRFYSHQPDLNFENPLVQKEVFRALDFWFEIGVDGLRLDAVPYLFEGEGTNCENLQATHDFIRKLRQHMDSKFNDRVLIAEANQWPEDAVSYFGKGDECHMAFHFPVMPRLFMAIQMEDRFPIIDILDQIPILPSNCQWVMFLRNHDELTLEMVSDEERDYMYRIYAKDPKSRINLGIRRRLAPLLDNDRAKIELMNILLFSLPGTPVIYYGDEIGMGDNYYLGDRNGVRTPMQWSPDRNAGFSQANPQRLYLPIIIDPAYHYEVVNVENHERNPSSLLWWIRRILLVRKNCKAFGFGSLEFISSDNSKIIAFTRTYETEIILVVANLSRFPQAAELDMAKYIGYIPRELFHHNRFPMVKDKSYNVTMGPYGYFWLSLKPSQALVHLTQESSIPTFYVSKHWSNILKTPLRQKFEREALPSFLNNARWFARKSATIQSVRIVFEVDLGISKLCFLEVKYLEVEDTDTYVITIVFAPKPEAEQIVLNLPRSIMANINIDGQEGILYDGIYSPHVREAFFNLFLNHKKVKVNSDELIPYTNNLVNGQLIKDNPEKLTSQVIKSEQSNSSFIYGNQFFLKLYRRLEEGINPEIEIEKFLTEKANFPHIPQFAGTIKWQRPRKAISSVAILQTFVPHESSGWAFTLDTLAKYYEQILAINIDDIQQATSIPNEQERKQPQIEELIGGRYLEAARLLGQRTGELHLALCSHPEDSAFSPEPYTILYQRSIYQSMRGSVRTAFQLLKKNVDNLPGSLKTLAEEIMKVELDLLSFYHRIILAKISVVRTRIHGDYHLGQILWTGKDFCITDFEGEPMHSLSARRIKRSPLRDVAGMLRSFYYAAHKVLLSDTVIRPEWVPKLEPWANLWYQHVSQIFLNSYFETVRNSPIPIICKNLDDCAYLIQVFILDKAVYELLYELNSRPDWISIPCKGIIYHLKNPIKF